MDKPAPTNVLATFAEELGGTEIKATSRGSVDFYLGPVPAMAYLKEGDARIRGSVFLDPAVYESQAKAWVARQPQPISGVLEAAGNPDEPDQAILRILFERPLANHDALMDPLYDDALDYAQAWHEHGDVGEPLEAASFKTQGDPRDIPPANAWLLMSDDASFPTADHLAQDGPLEHGGIFETEWTCAKQTEVGDLVLVYFVAPRKAVHFVARAASRAFFDRNRPVNADGTVRDEQWWAYLTGLIEIEPISIQVLREHADGHLPLRGRSGHYLRPELIRHLPVRAKHASDQAALERVLRTPVGQADLPDPAAMTMEQWPRLASGAMRLEADVSQHLVEPLLRHATDGTNLTWEAEHRVGRKYADYVVLDGDQPRCVVEVKLAIRTAPDHEWAHSKDVLQVRGYAKALHCRAVLLDAHRVLLFDKGEVQPKLVIDRRSISLSHLDAIISHLAEAGDLVTRTISRRTRNPV